MVEELPENIHIVPHIALEKLKEIAKLEAEEAEERGEGVSEMIDYEDKSPTEEEKEGDSKKKIRPLGVIATPVKKELEQTPSKRNNKKEQGSKKRNMLQTVYDKLKKGMDLADFSIPELFVGLKYYHAKKPKRNFDDFVKRSMTLKEEFIEKLKYYQYHCSICTFIDVKHDIQKFMESTLVKRTDILEYDSVSTDLRNGYAIIKNDIYKEIVLYINGTQTMKDVMTDLNGHSIRFMEGWAHAGMSGWAKWFEEHKRQQLKDYLETYPEYKIKLVGHSLGGAVAALVGLLIRDDFPNLTVFCIAIPKCVSEHLTPITEEFITSLVYMDDFVPLLSMSTVKELRHRVATCNWKHHVYQDVDSWAPIKKLKKISNRFNKAWGSLGETNARNKTIDELKEEVELKARMKRMNQKERIALAADEEVGMKEDMKKTTIKPLLTMRSRSMSSPPTPVNHTEIVSSVSTPEEVDVFDLDDEDDEDIVPLYNPGQIYYIRIIDNVVYTTKETYQSAFLNKLEFNRSYITDHYCESYREALIKLIDQYYTLKKYETAKASSNLLDFENDLFD
mmetsp:Transcript_3430/g.5056  ORF Transcript_3430/g.5056 Transcript_3430/m.5056 type:complete len:562 (-) Transcript_3430:84-1769(-)